jgi:hypothetical protein
MNKMLEEARQKMNSTLSNPIHKQLQELGISQGGALNLNQACRRLKQLNLNKLSDAGGLKFSGCPTPRKTNS